MGGGVGIYAHESLLGVDMCSKLAPICTRKGCAGLCGESDIIPHLSDLR